MVPANGYTQAQWAAKLQRDKEWRDTTFQWKKERRPLIAEFQTLAKLHRADFPELAEQAEKEDWVTRSFYAEHIWAGIERAAVTAAERLNQPASTQRETSEDHSRQSKDTHAQQTAPLQELSGVARSLAFLTDHPDWTDEQIAEAAGLSRTTLYDYDLFKKARALLKAKKSPRDRRRGRTGKRLADTNADIEIDD